MIEASIAVATYLFIIVFTIAGMFVGGNKKARESWVIATGCAVLAILLVIGIILHGPVPEDHVAAERESVTQSDN